MREEEVVGNRSEIGVRAGCRKRSLVGESWLVPNGWKNVAVLEPVLFMIW